MFDLFKLGNENQNGLRVIRPLNLTGPEYARHFELPTPPRFNPIMVLLARDLDALNRSGTLVEDLEPTFDAICASIPELQATNPYVFTDVGDHWLWEQMPDSMRNWMVDGIYPQLCFYDITRAGDLQPYRSLANAESWLDLWVNIGTSIEPADHGPIELVVPDDLSSIIADGWDPDMSVRGYQLMINDLYRENVGLHIRSLMNARNEIMVKIGAVLRNLDPQEEYRRFVNEGHDYFLDFTFGNV